MVDRATEFHSDRLAASGDESGAAPEDRTFRPDVEGLRAVAVLLVVLFHSGITALSGGYLGVDVFFVISGFVITGALLREQAASGRTSIVAFYGRRCRRIIPAASVVIIATVALSYIFLGRAGDRTATDARWASIFLANFHFSAIGTNYFTALRPPSPLQNYWSLSVEEQFYIVYPTFLLLLAAVRTRVSLRAKLAIGLCVVMCASLAWSVVETHSNVTAAYFSPLTRAWELALGALVAVGTPWLKKVPLKVAAVMTWLGFAAILVAAHVFNSQSAYPGSLASIPVLGAAFIIAGGVKAPRLGVEVLLGRVAFRGLGKISYSLYLWHWPILIIAAEHAGKTSLPIPQSLGWDVVALCASVVTYFAVENPVRHAKLLLRSRLASVGVGVAVILTTLSVVAVQSATALGSSIGLGAAAASLGGVDATPQAVSRLVAESASINAVPSNVVPSFSQVTSNSPADVGWPRDSCFGWTSKFTVSACTFGDRAGSFTMVLYGDSHAGQWFHALDDIATKEHWRLVVLTRPSCPADPLSVEPVGGGGDFTGCDQWHQLAMSTINSIHPDLVIISQISYYKHPDGSYYLPDEWQRGLEQLLQGLSIPQTAKLVLGDTPSNLGSECLAQHPDGVQGCSLPSVNDRTPYENAEAAAAADQGVRYVDVYPWFCTTVCSAVIGQDDVYIDGGHITRAYTSFLEQVLDQSLDLSGRETSKPR